MTARTAGFLSRSAIGLRRPRSISRNIRPANGGVVLHYGGPSPRIRSHPDCLATWRAWQHYHMDTHGWADLAYSLGVCDHGYVLAGRGAGVRTAANGTNAANSDYYAVCWIGGSSNAPTVLALDAVEWAVAELRRAGGAGRSVRPHHRFRSTSCPGRQLTAHARRLDGKATTAPAPAPVVVAPPLPKDEPMARLIKTANAPHVFGTDGVGYKWHVPSTEVLADLRKSGVYGDGAITVVSEATINSLRTVGDT